MKTTTNRAVETLLFISFPLALFAGCAGNANTKLTMDEPVTQAKPVAPWVAEASPVAETTEDSPIVLLIDILNAEREQAELDAKRQEAELSAQADSPFVVKTSDIDSAQAMATMETDTDEAMVEVNLTERLQPQLAVVNFDVNATAIDESYLAVLQEHAEFLQKHPGLILTINGHADSRGSVEYNRQLSEERALNVYNILLSYGAPDMQLIVDALGESSPLTDETHFSENRRVELEYSEEMVLSSIE